jgi:hypothetical protein
MSRGGSRRRSRSGGGGSDVIPTKFSTASAHTHTHDSEQKGLFPTYHLLFKCGVAVAAVGAGLEAGAKYLSLESVLMPAAGVSATSGVGAVAAVTRAVSESSVASSSEYFASSCALSSVSLFSAALHPVCRQRSTSDQRKFTTKTSNEQTYDCEWWTFPETSKARYETGV